MTYRAAILAAGREYLQRLLAEKGGCVTKAALEAGVCRPTMYKLLSRHGIQHAKQAVPRDGLPVPDDGALDRPGGVPGL